MVIQRILYELRLNRKQEMIRGTGVTEISFSWGVTESSTEIDFNSALEG